MLSLKRLLLISLLISTITGCVGLDVGGRKYRLTTDGVVDVNNETYSLSQRSKVHKRPLNAGEIAFFEAVKSGDVDLAKQLRKGAEDIELMTDAGETLSHMAAYSGNSDMVHYVVAIGADLNDCGAATFCPVHIATLVDDPGFIQSFGELGANFDRVSPFDQRSIPAVSYAIEKGLSDAAIALVKGGADPNNRDSDGSPPSFYALLHKEISVLDTLLKSGADPDADDVDKNTLLMVAASYGSLPMVQSLVESGADTYRVNRNGSTAVSIAAERKRWDVVRYLNKVNENG